jgi:hypothetical protein
VWKPSSLCSAGRVERVKSSTFGLRVDWSVFPHAQPKQVRAPSVAVLVPRRMRSKLSSACAVLLGSLSWTLSAFAGPEVETHSAESPEAAAAHPAVLVSEKTERYWYGWKVALVGGVAATLITFGVATQTSVDLARVSGWSLSLGVPILVFGSPIVHWSNHYWGKGWVSFGANVTLPIAAGLVGGTVACAGSSAGPDCRGNGFWTGFAVAALIVPWIDALFLGWKEVTVERTVAGKAGDRSDVRLALGVGGLDAPTLGIYGRF